MKHESWIGRATCGERADESWGRWLTSTGESDGILMIEWDVILMTEWDVKSVRKMIDI